MYKIKYNDAVICTPQFKEFAAIAGTLQEGLNAVSVFSFTLPPKHPYLDSMEGRNGLVKLYDDDNVLFIGDIVNRKESFDCTTEIECQDALGWLNDVVFVKPTFSGAIENYWASLLGKYNQEASEWRKINIGTVTVQGNISINHDTEFLTIFDLVSELTQLSGGYVSVRYEGEEIFLDYLVQANTESDQSILFGANLINLEDFVSEEQIFSRIYPRGKDGLDISSVNGGLTYLANGTTESMFGIVAVTVDFDTESATELKALGQAYLEANGLASRTLTLTAFDLSLVDKNYTEIKVGNIVPVISPLHGINTKMQVNAKTTDIVAPENSSFTLGLILNTISGIMASGGGTSKTISGQVTPPVKITGAVRYDITQTLIDGEKARARANIGAGTSNFDGRYSSLSGKPTIPTKTSDLTNDSGFGTYSKPAGGIPESDLSYDVQTKLNLIGTFCINVISSNGAYSADKTFDEIKAAYEAGQQPYVVYGGNTIYTLSYCYFASERMFMDFERYLIWEDTLATETLRIYSYTTGSGSNIVKRTEEFNVPSNSYVLLVDGVESTDSSITLTSEQVTALQAAAQNNRPITLVLRDGSYYTTYHPFVVGNTSMMFSRGCNFNSLLGDVDVNQALGRIIVASITITDNTGTVSFIEFVSGLTPFLPLSLSITWTEQANSYTLTDKEYAILRQSLLDKRPIFIVRNTADAGGEQTVYSLSTCETPSVLNVDSMTLVLRGLNNGIKVQMADKTIVPDADVPSVVKSVNGKTGAVTLNAEDIIYAKESQKLDVTIASLKAADVQMTSDISELQTALQSKSITDSGGYFTTDTVEGALQEIGAELAGINTLLGSGIQISFTIDGDPFSAVSGETWKEWIGGYSRVISEISGLTLYCFSDDGIIFADEAGVNALGLNDVWVHGNETIVSGATYAIIPCGG